MSIIVYGVDKPSRCRNCPFCIATDPDSDDSPYECVINQYLHWETWTDVPLFISEGCKIGEIPKPHGDLIDRDFLKVCAEDIEVSLPTSLAFSTLVEDIKSVDTIIKAEKGDG